MAYSFYLKYRDINSMSFHSMPKNKRGIQNYTENRLVLLTCPVAIVNPIFTSLKHVIKIIFNQFPDCHHYCQKIYLVYLNECVGFFLYNQYLQVGQEFKLIQFSNFIKLPEMTK